MPPRSGVNLNLLFAGSILALTSISVNTGTVVEGRALARNGSVTLDNHTFAARACSVGPTPTATPTSTATATPTATSTPRTGPVVETDRPGNTGSGSGLIAVVAALVAGTGVLVLGRRRPGAQR